MNKYQQSFSSFQFEEVPEFLSVALLLLFRNLDFNCFYPADRALNPGLLLLVLQPLPPTVLLVLMATRESNHVVNAVVVYAAKTFAVAEVQKFYFLELFEKYEIDALFAHCYFGHYHPVHLQLILVQLQLLSGGEVSKHVLILQRVLGDKVHETLLVTALLYYSQQDFQLILNRNEGL